MNRRGFLKLLSGGSLAAVVAPYLKLSDEDLATLPYSPVINQARINPTFSETHEYGNAIPFYGKEGIAKDLALFSRKLLIEDAQRNIPPGYLIEIRRRIPGEFGRLHGLAWYYSPEFSGYERKIKTTGTGKKVDPVMIDTQWVMKWTKKKNAAILAPLSWSNEGRFSKLGGYFLMERILL